MKIKQVITKPMEIRFIEDGEAVIKTIDPGTYFIEFGEVIDSTGGMQTVEATLFKEE